MVRKRFLGQISVDDVRGVILCELPIAEGPWWALGVLQLHEHRLLLTEIRVFPGGTVECRKAQAYGAGEWSGDASEVPPGGVPYRVLRDIRPSEFFEQAYAWADGMCRVVPVKWAMDLMYSLPVETDDISTKTGAGSPELELARLAARWVQKREAGSRRPTRDIADEDGLTGDDWKKVRDRIYKARRKGLLSGGAAGRVDGGLTDRARRLLAGADWHDERGDAS